MNLLILIKSFFLINILKSRDGSININEFTTLCTALFRNEAGKPYKLDQGENNSDKWINPHCSYKLDHGITIKWFSKLTLTLADWTLLKKQTCVFELDLSLLCSFGHRHVYDLQHLRRWKHEQVLYLGDREIECDTKIHWQCQSDTYMSIQASFPDYFHAWT